MRRREFISLLGGAAAAWPLAAQTQQPIRRIGMLLPAAAEVAEIQARVGAFLEGLQQSGWTIGQNVRIDSRWATTNAVEIRRHAAELAALAPDAILAASSETLAALQQATRTVPIVFVIVPDPVSAGYVDSLSRPGGNATGFLMFEYGLAAKWLELLKEDRAGGDASGGPSGSRHSRRDWPVRHHPVRRAPSRMTGVKQT
jgi:putative tryptophan/tyrosine transport system substrate-binding protein